MACGAMDDELNGPVVAFGEAAEPDDVAVVEAAEKLQLPVERGGAAVILFAADGSSPPHRGDEAVGEAGPVCRAAWAARLERRAEAARRRLDLPRLEPPHERQRT